MYNMVKQNIYKYYIVAFCYQIFKLLFFSIWLNRSAIFD